MKSGLFRILLLEDETALRNDLREILQDKLPGTVVIPAGTIEEGLEKLEDEEDLVLGILDVRVPMRRGMQPEANPEVADRLRELRVPALFVTSYRESEDVADYLRNRSLTDATAVVIKKSLVPGKMTSELLGHIRLLLTQQASQQVEACVKALFGPSANGGPRSGTAALIDAQRTIVPYWPYLDDPTKQLVRRWFIVSEDTTSTVRLSLLDKEGYE